VTFPTYGLVQTRGRAYNIEKDVTAAAQPSLSFDVIANANSLFIHQIIILVTSFLRCLLLIHLTHRHQSHQLWIGIVIPAFSSLVVFCDHWGGPILFFRDRELRLFIDRFFVMQRGRCIL
jgi:hypothetical protein